jgi:hypothetical protein
MRQSGQGGWGAAQPTAGRHLSGAPGAQRRAGLLPRSKRWNVRGGSNNRNSSRSQRWSRGLRYRLPFTANQRPTLGAAPVDSSRSTPCTKGSSSSSRRLSLAAAPPPPCRAIPHTSNSRGWPPPAAYRRSSWRRQRCRDSTHPRTSRRCRIAESETRLFSCDMNQKTS